MKHRKEPGLQDAPGDCDQQTPNPLQTVAERSAWKATSTHADVMAFCRALVERSPQVTLEIVGKTYEGRELPLLILADPPIATPTEARQSGKLVCFAFGAIHAGEVCGKEGLLILAREIALTSNHPLLHDLVILFAPLMNADGNERMHPHNRPGQDGPEQGMGTRLNAMGLNLNRDWTKLETPENRAFARLMSRWDPAVILDLHATNGSRHQYMLTYDAPRHPAAHADVRTYTRDHFLPAAGTALEAATGYRSFFYGNFDHDNTMWRTYAGLPRFTTHYGGLRHRLTILAEAYKYAPYQDRVMGTLEFVRHCFLYARDHKHDIQALLARVDAETIAAGNNPQEGNMVALRSEHVVDEHPVVVHGFAGEQPHTLAVRYDGQSRPTLSTPRPYAYLMPPTDTPAQETLQYHGIEVLELCEDIDLDVEVYVLEALTSAPTPVEHHHLLTVEVTMHAETRRILAGTCLIRTGQQLGSLAVFLLEPASEDGLCAWNVFDAGLTVGGNILSYAYPGRYPDNATSACAGGRSDVQTACDLRRALWSGPTATVDRRPHRHHALA